MSLNIEHTFTVEIEPELISLFKNEEYCVPLEIHVDVEYDGDELLEDLRSIQVFHNEQDITSELTRKDYEAIQTLVSQEVTESAYAITDKLGESYEMLVEDGRY